MCARVFACLRLSGGFGAAWPVGLCVLSCARLVLFWGLRGPLGFAPCLVRSCACCGPLALLGVCVSRVCQGFWLGVVFGGLTRIHSWHEFGRSKKKLLTLRMSVYSSWYVYAAVSHGRMHSKV